MSLPERFTRKETFKGDSPTKLRQAVCAFANDLPDRRRPGVAFVGADDGALGAHAVAANDAGRDFREIVTALESRIARVL